MFWELLMAWAFMGFVLFRLFSVEDLIRKELQSQTRQLSDDLSDIKRRLNKLDKIEGLAEKLDKIEYKLIKLS